MRRRLVCAVAALMFCAGFAPPPSLVRDQRDVVVGGIRETWRLVWADAPKEVCRADDVGASTCPCNGFAYGEAGDLWLERHRPGAQVERLRLAPLFKDYLDIDAPGAVLQRTPWRESDGDPDGRALAVAAAIAARPAAPVLRLADYDHDGRATEFLLQVGTMPCGKRMAVAVGVSRSNPHLHALSSAAHPKRPLVMPVWVWEALAKRSPKPHEIWSCGDHGSSVRSMLTISARNGTIRAVNRDYGCRGERNAGRLVQTVEW